MMRCFDLGLADRIRKECPESRPACCARFSYSEQCAKHGQNLWLYVGRNWDAYRKSDAEKARMKARGLPYLKGEGGRYF